MCFSSNINKNLNSNHWRTFSRHQVLVFFLVSVLCLFVFISGETLMWVGKKQTQERQISIWEDSWTLNVSELCFQSTNWYKVLSYWTISNLYIKNLNARNSLEVLFDHSYWANSPPCEELFCYFRQIKNAVLFSYSIHVCAPATPIKLNDHNVFWRHWWWHMNTGCQVKN